MSEADAPRPVPAKRPAEASPAPASSQPTPASVARQWLRHIRRGSQLTPSDPDQAVAPVPGRNASLLDRSPFQIGFLLALGAMTAYGLIQAIVSLQSVIILVVLSLFLALGLNPLVEWLHVRGVSRGLAVTVVALAVLSVIGLGVWAVLPVVTQQVNNLILNAPAYLQALRENPQIAEVDQQFDVINKATAFLTSGSWLEAMFGGLLGASRALANIVFSLIITLVLTLYCLASLPAIKNTIYQLAPASRRPRVRYLANEMFRRIGGYVTGMFVVVTCSATAAFVFVNIVGLGQYSLALAVVVAGFAFIPLVGSTASMVIVSIVAFANSPTTGLITLAFFLIYQQIDTYLIQPRMFQRSVSVPGVLVVLAALSGGFLLGIVGALLAIPTAASLLLLYREVVVPHLDRT